MVRDPGPDTRTTPMPPAPGAVAMAAMVSAVIMRAARRMHSRLLALGGLLACRLPFRESIDMPLLRDRKDVVHQPVQYQTCREEEEEHAEYDRHHHHDLGLDRIRRLGIESGLDDHGRTHED